MAAAKINLASLPVFPPADVFPMMSDEELDELAQDIKENGLREPIVVAEVTTTDPATGDRLRQLQLVDGRNRREACLRIKVMPEFQHLANGEDLTAYVVSANVQRRHLTAGQRAMAVALIRPDPEKGGRGKKAATTGAFPGVGHQRISDARAVLRYSPELAQAVMRGEKALQAALAEARASQGSVLAARTQLTRLRDERPDLADLVVSEAITLEEAVERAESESEDRKRRRWAATMQILDSVVPLDRAPEEAVEHVAMYDQALAESRGEAITPARLRRAAAYLGALASALEKRQRTA